MRKIGLGIIGLGYIGRVHLQNSIKLKNAQLVAACDASKKALKIAYNAGVRKVCTNYEELLKDPNVDAVLIALPTHLHYDCAVVAAEAKKHIMLEKPIAKNTKEAREIVSAGAKNSVKLMVGYPLRFDQRFSNLKEKIEMGLLGDVEVAHAINVSYGPFFSRGEGHIPTPVPEWWFKKEANGGGALIDLGSHMINLLRWYFGEVTDIKASLGYRYNLDVEDSANCLVKFESGTTAIVTVGWFSQKFLLRMELFGSVTHEETVELKSNPLLTVARALTTGSSNFFSPHLCELQHFVRCITEDSAPSSSGQDGLKDLETIIKAYENPIELACKTRS